ncbi:PREDICTED: single-stranded DNA-binding protein WHY2, mitochondrial-like [Camelina sativa]|uniref:Single-stranded DNA-binding protein WHY2, mitochondrial-like n=1 Tax=Camelina sativa TaxID=90675 RepID=A0ABM0TL14_CAMSA|nr:PREDICTED: single-stranded DNA-binding protein WHY2, mitochondrial-like [Camelina sativa]
MMKQARTLLSRSLCDQHKSLLEEKVRATTLRGFASWSDSSPSRGGFSGQKDAAKPSGRVFAPYAIFKGKAALSVEPVLPTFTEIDSGNLRIERRGSLRMTFMPSIGERKYDGGQKQLFSLSPTEVGSLISMGSKDSSEFFHDPSMKSSNAGQVRKTLSIKPHADGSGYFFSLSVVNNILNTNDRFVVPVTTAEFAVMKTAFSFALPHIMGWDRVIDQVGTGTQKTTSQHLTTGPQHIEQEWDK